MKRIAPLLLVFSVVLGACSPSGKEDYAGWSTFRGPSDAFAIRVLEPPWAQCSGTEYETACRVCPRQILGRAACGGAHRSASLWIPPRLLDPEYLLIPPYNLEITWFNSDHPALDLARTEGNAVVRAGFEQVIEPRAVSLHDGTMAAEVAYHGPMYLVTNEDPVDRPDERDFRVVYVNEGSMAYRVALDTAININLSEVRDLLSSFTLHPGPAEGGD